MTDTVVFPHFLLRGDYEAALEMSEKVTVEGRRRSVRALTYQAMGQIEKAELEALIALGDQ